MLMLGSRREIPLLYLLRHSVFETPAHRRRASARPVLGRNAWAPGAGTMMPRQLLNGTQRRQLRARWRQSKSPGDAVKVMLIATGVHRLLGAGD